LDEDQSNSEDGSEGDWNYPEGGEVVHIEDIPPDIIPAKVGLPAFEDFPMAMGLLAR